MVFILTCTHVRMLKFCQLVEGSLALLFSICTHEWTLSSSALVDFKVRGSSADEDSGSSYQYFFLFLVGVSLQTYLGRLPHFHWQTIFVKDTFAIKDQLIKIDGVTSSVVATSAISL